MFGIPEEQNGETYFCADFYKAEKDILAKEFFERIDKSDDAHCRGPFSNQPRKSTKIAFIINPNEEVQELLETDMYNPKNKNAALQNQLNLLEKFNEGGEQEGRAAAIPYGVPTNCISGVVLGDYLLENERYVEVIKEIFPNCYIMDHVGKTFFDPNISKDENTTNKNECLKNIEKRRIEKRKIDIDERYLKNAPKKNEVYKQKNTTQQIGKVTINAPTKEKDEIQEKINSEIKEREQDKKQEQK